MRVLGIDPGTLITGYGLIEERNTDFTYLSSGKIKTSPRDPLSCRLKKIYNDLTEIMEKYSPNVTAVESLFFSKDAKSALKLGHARGVAILASANYEIPVAEYSPAEIKKAIVGNGRADKSQIKYMVSVLLNLQQANYSFDVSDALAVAVCHIHQASFNEMVKG